MEYAKARKRGNCNGNELISWLCVVHCSTMTTNSSHERTCSHERTSSHEQTSSYNKLPRMNKYPRCRNSTNHTIPWQEWISPSIRVTKRSAPRAPLRPAPSWDGNRNRRRQTRRCLHIMVLFNLVHLHVDHDVLLSRFLPSRLVSASHQSAQVSQCRLSALLIRH